MAIYWRISDYPDLNGEGGRKAGARWHTAGSRIVYLAESPMAALVETLVHLDVLPFNRSIPLPGPNGSSTWT